MGRESCEAPVVLKHGSQVIDCNPLNYGFGPTINLQVRRLPYEDLSRYITNTALKQPL